MLPNQQWPAGLSLRGTEATGPVLEVATPACSTRISLRGGHVLHWQPAGHAPVLWLSPGAKFAEGKAIRGGIPVCWPWFSDHPTDLQKPSHGFARIRDWQVVEADRTSDTVRIILALPGDDRDQNLWPHTSRPRLTITAGTDLQLALAIENTDAQPLRITQALHTYFTISDIRAIAIEGLDGATYYDKVTDRPGLLQDGGITFAGEVDRIYRHGPGAIVLNDPGMTRTITIRQTGGSSIVVWNPWIEKTRRLGDMGPDDSYRGMVCVETGSVGEQAVELAPGAVHVLETTISVGPATS